MKVWSKKVSGPFSYLWKKSFWCGHAFVGNPNRGELSEAGALQALKVLQVLLLTRRLDNRSIH